MGNNRAFIYGDLLFETIRKTDGKINYASLHANRLKAGADLLGMILPDNWSTAYFIDLLDTLVMDHNARIRLVMYRHGNGFYLPNSNDVLFSAESWPLPKPKTAINKLGIYQSQYKSCCSLSNLKSGNALIYVAAAKYAHENNFEDVLILNQHGRVAEANSSNVFWIKNGMIFTTPLSEGPVAGIMREALLQFAHKNGILIEQHPVEINELENADELFLTNALHGIVFVNEFNGKKMGNEISSSLKKDLAIKLEF